MIRPRPRCGPFHPGGCRVKRGRRERDLPTARPRVNTRRAVALAEDLEPPPGWIVRDEHYPEKTAPRAAAQAQIKKSRSLVYETWTSSAATASTIGGAQTVDLD